VERDGVVAGMTGSERVCQGTRRTDRHTTSAACVCPSSTDRLESPWQRESRHCVLGPSVDVHLHCTVSASLCSASYVC